jgi:hypothetical protein
MDSGCGVRGSVIEISHSGFVYGVVFSFGFSQSGFDFSHIGVDFSHISVDFSHIGVDFSHIGVDFSYSGFGVVFSHRYVHRTVGGSTGRESRVSRQSAACSR